MGVDGCGAAQVVKKAPLKRAAPPSTKAPAVKKRPPPEGTRLLPAWAYSLVVNKYLSMSVLSVKACSVHAHRKLFLRAGHNKGVMAVQPWYLSEK